MTSLPTYPKCFGTTCILHYGRNQVFSPKGIKGIVYSMEQFWSGVLEWSGVKFWSGKNDLSCLNRQQNNTGALTWSLSLDVFICPAIF